MINKTIIQGRFVREPEMRYTQSGKSVCTFTIAWSTKRGERDVKLFLKCTAWNKTADNVSKWFHKGQEAVVIGELETKQWTDKEGNNRQANEMNAQEVHFCGPKNENGNYNDEVERRADEFSEISEDDELPW